MKEEFFFNDVENKGEGRERLLRLEKTGLYLFHGSGQSALSELTPSLPYTIKDGIREPHSDRPTVSATPSVDMAIFYAVVNQDNRKVSFDVEHATYFATQKALEYAKTHTGFVYVVNRDEFAYPVGKSPQAEIRTDRPVKVLEVVSVSYKDLAMDIKLLPPFSPKF